MLTCSADSHRMSLTRISDSARLTLMLGLGARLHQRAAAHLRASRLSCPGSSHVGDRKARVGHTSRDQGAALPQSVRTGLHRDAQILISFRLEKAYHRCAAELGVKDSEEAAAAFGASVGSWPAFPDSADCRGWG
jgi:hypothetical protein